MSQALVSAPSLTARQVWWHAVRPATLAASVAPLLMATSIAVHDGRVRPWPGAGALLVAVGIQVGVNFANDYSDFRRGADTSARVGPPRAAASGLVEPETVRNAALLTFGVVAVAGAAVSVATDWRLLGIGAVCIAAAWFYTGGPRPYGYAGLGELFAFVFFGPVAAAGTAYVHEATVPLPAVLAGLAAGLFAAAILALNNLRDIDTDRAAGKLTLAVRIGPARTRRLVRTAMLAAYLVPLAAAASGAGMGVLLPLLSLPMAVLPLRLARRTKAADLVAGLKAAAALEMVFALLWAVGVVVS